MQDDLKRRFTILDGAMGTMIQARGLKMGQLPDTFSITHPSDMREIYQSYIDAGSDIIYANTFGSSGKRVAETDYTLEEIISASVGIAVDVARAFGVRVALDMGPLGELLEPMGTLTFEEAYELFREVAMLGEKHGAQLIAIETMTDLYEAKAALLAVKENTSLPAFVTMSFEERGRTFTGCAAESMARTLAGLGADAIGVNCSLGPQTLAPIVETIARSTRLPVIAKPNAGLPDPMTGKYDMDEETFARGIRRCVEAGATIVGGCCGTTPAYIAAVKAALEGVAVPSRVYEAKSFVCTPTVPLTIEKVAVIGERVNPTGKKRFRQALEDGDMDYILDVALQEVEAGADILDVNVGSPDIDEAVMLPKVVKMIQAACDTPLQLDSTNPKALEAALRIYNGKAAVNSINGDKESMDAILPIVRKYGASVVGLTLNEGGLPTSAKERIAIAKNILEETRRYGIPDEDVWIDCLTLTASAQQEQAVETLKAVRYMTDELHLKTVLGVSNISFGLPHRELINRTFLAQALEAGLSLPIINPNIPAMMDTIAAHKVLCGQDRASMSFIEKYGVQDAASTVATPAKSNAQLTLSEAITKGLKEEAGRLASEEIKLHDSLYIVENILIPALDKVGDEYEKGKVYLPQLMASAEAAKVVFEVIKTIMVSSGQKSETKGNIAIATVKGDIHDIGKNIVKTVLANYGYEVHDLGRDVPPEKIVDFVKAHDIKLVGLSALMTTTLPSMAETARQLSLLKSPPVIVCGGAVVTPEYTQKIGARYAKDAKQCVDIAKEVWR